MQARYGAGAASPLRGVTPDPRQPGPASHLDRRKRGLVSRVTGPPDVMPGPHFEGRGFPAVGEPPERRRFGSNTPARRSAEITAATVRNRGCARVWWESRCWRWERPSHSSGLFPMPSAALARVCLPDCARAMTADSGSDGVVRQSRVSGTRSAALFEGKGRREPDYGNHNPRRNRRADGRVGCYLTCPRCVPRCPPPYVP